MGYLWAGFSLLLCRVAHKGVDSHSGPQISHRGGDCVVWRDKAMSPPASKEAATYCLQHCTTPRVLASWRNCF